MKESCFRSFVILTLLVETIFTVVCFLILTIRVQSVMRDSLYAQSTGAESSPLYGIYKAWKGDVVYAGLQEEPTPMPYNYLFYYGYGIAAKPLTSRGEGLALFTRFLTLAATGGFLIIMLCHLWYQSRRLEGDDGSWPIRAAILLAVVGTFFGPFTGWFYLSARPDLIAAGLELTGLLLFLRFLTVEKTGFVLAATFFFCLGWSVKQSAVFVWLGSLGVMLVDRRWKHVMLSVITFGLLGAIPYGLLGWHYVEHTILVPTMFPWQLKELLLWGKQAFVTGSYVFIPALALIISLVCGLLPKMGRTVSALLVILVVTVTGNMLLTGKLGSGRYYYFSSLFVAQLLVAHYVFVHWRSLDEAKRTLVTVVLLIGFCLGMGLSSAYFLFPNRVGRIELMTVQEREQALRVTKLIFSAKRPVLVEPSYYALPWLSGQYPSEVINWTFHSVARESRFAFPLERRISDRFYAEAFVFDGEWSERFARSGYKRTSRVGSINHFVRQ